MIWILTRNICFHEGRGARFTGSQTEPDSDPALAHRAVFWRPFHGLGKRNARFNPALTHGAIFWRPFHGLGNVMRVSTRRLRTGLYSGARFTGWEHNARFDPALAHGAIFWRPFHGLGNETGGAYSNRNVGP